MNERTGQSTKEIALRKYFMKPPSYGCAVTLIVLGAGFAFATIAAFASSQGGASGAMGQLLVALVLLGGGALWIRAVKAKREKKPSDNQVQGWLTEGVQNLALRSRVSLGLGEEEGSFSEPLVITGPVLWQTNGISSEDLVWKKGDDGNVRFGIYRVTIIRLTDRHLGAFACDYNFIKDVALNERTDEYHYRDVVSVSTREESTSYTLPTGEKLTTAQNFSLSVASGESIRVTIDAAQLRKITGVDKLPETGAERVVTAIRAMLRDKKA